MADLDLRVFDADGSVVSSLTLRQQLRVGRVHRRRLPARHGSRCASRASRASRSGMGWRGRRRTSVRRAGSPARIDTRRLRRISSRTLRGRRARRVRRHRRATSPTPWRLARWPACRAARCLLTDPNSLPQATRDELARLRPGRIVIAGGPGAVSDARCAGAAGLHRPTGLPPGGRRSVRDGGRGQPRLVRSRRAGGIHRHRALLPRCARRRPGRDPHGRTGAAHAAGLAAAGHARRAGAPPARADLVVGGSGVVGDEVVSPSCNRSRRSAVDRVAGPDRYATAAAISSVFFGASPSIYLATGTNYPDALAAVPGAGRAGSPLLLVRGSRGSGAGDRRADADLATAHLDRRRHGRHRRRRPAVHQRPCSESRETDGPGDGRPRSLRRRPRARPSLPPRPTPRATPTTSPSVTTLPARHADAGVDRASAGAIRHRAPRRGGHPSTRRRS